VNLLRRSAVQVHVDPQLCQGHNRCYAIAPELFEVDDEGNATELHDGVVPAALEEKARLAVANCPEYAITLTEPTITEDS
jgi:ferredoxin